jgi:hypothetical protein
VVPRSQKHLPGGSAAKSTSAHRSFLHMVLSLAVKSSRVHVTIGITIRLSSSRSKRGGRSGERRADALSSLLNWSFG